MQTSLGSVEDVAHLELAGGDGAEVGAERLVQLQRAPILTAKRTYWGFVWVLRNCERLVRHLFKITWLRDKMNYVSIFSCWNELYRGCLAH